MALEHNLPEKKTGTLGKLHEALPYTSLMERILLFLFAVALIGATLLMLWRINENFLVTVPADGGSLVEGIVGTPRFVNPVLALTDADKDLSMLVYSGLMRPSVDGLTFDLAENYDISEDGLTYTFHIKDNITFHNGDSVTAEDVAYTISMIQDPLVKSPQRSNWEGVKVSIVDQYTISFTLKESYSSFLENTTLGILPKSVWKDLSPEQFSLSEQNVNPIGSGPYKIASIDKDKDGFPKTYILKPFTSYALGAPHISRITTHFFVNQTELIEALKRKEIDSASAITPSHIKDLSEGQFHFETVVLPRVFAIFFNQNKQPVFANTEVREALNTAVNRDILIETVLGGFGEALDGPSPDDVQTYDTEEDPILIAQTILEENDWEKDESGIYKNGSETLAFTITTADVPELKAAAEHVQSVWRLVGADVKVEVYDTTALNQNVIRPREFDALLFGEVVGRDRDLYPFWHSSGRNDPGLNVALYTNGAVDKLLESMRKTTDPVTWQTDYEAVREEIKSDFPAVFLYAPKLIYITPDFVNNFSFADIGIASERFSTIHEWYIDTQRVWNIFAQKTIKNY
ncbi:MAG: hypothetical protein COV34_02670 [Candidatus Zambryskibacteria bacterium CG10_big_fil_rev_8_21_14_0_10_42_12]|uniref:Solute-binding protein family 5 domain-containing protein n=1 Tax=Candidatus Zambryskibacteria bacterium CG10_big_fil_rev_8_21_14_0_10_42_12 TaxID=1975115 RepID=A0A2H0QVJ2_9BACT|nr:MAG: hypothetical protein COV34_02670 [Candidatus Zambryskibacteria bacterium CG10_big_fil_rev_8_21_14_0_10_42_12]